MTKAWSVDIIGKQVRGSSQTPGHTNRAKAEKFVAVVRARVPTDPNTFDSFVSILRSSPSLGHLADRLEEKICDRCKMAQLGRGVIDSSTPRSRFPHAMNYQPTSHNREHSPSGLPMATKPQRRKPKKPHSSSTASRTSTHTGHNTSSGIPKLETRDETDEESGFLEEESAAASMTIESDSNDDSQDDIGDTQSSSFVTATSGPTFSTPINVSDAAAEYKAFADNTVGDGEAHVTPPSQDFSSEPVYYNESVAKAGIQEIEHGTVSQHQVVGGVQPSSGWADMAHFCISKGAEQQSQLTFDKESLQIELNDCKQKLADTEHQLEALTKKRDTDIRQAKEKLRKEKEDHEAKITAAENDVSLLKQELKDKTQEAEELRQRSEQLQRKYDELKCTSEKAIEDLKEQLSYKEAAAAKLRDDYDKLERDSERKLAAIKESYDKKINDLERTVQLERKVAASAQEALIYKMKAEYLEKENSEIQEKNNLQIKIKDLENELASEREKIAVLQKKEVEAQLNMVRRQSAVKLQEVQRERDQYKMTVQRMSSNSSTSSCNSVSTSSISRSNTADKDELDAIVEEAEAKLRIESDSSDDSFHSCNSDV